MTEEEILSFRIAEKRDSVVLEFLPASGASGLLALTLDQLTSLIRALGAVRENMVADGPVPPLEGERIQPVRDMRWFIQPEPLSEGSLLTYYHPGFGPVGFVMPKDQVSEVVRILTAHLTIRPSAGRPN